MIARPLVPAPATARAGPAGRLAFAFGPRFFVLLGAGLVLAIPAWLDSRALWALAAWNVFVAALWLADLRRIPTGDQLELTRTWATPLSLGVPARVALDVRNRSAIALRIDSIDDVPSALRADLPRGLTEVAPDQAGRIEYDVSPAERGDVPVGGISLRVRSPWAVAERWLSAPASQTVRVYPDMVAARRQSMFLLRSRQVALEKRRVRMVGLGRDFESLREYQPGDETRDICWTASARRGKPVTKVYQPERSQALWIIVDGGRLLRARDGEVSKLDGMVDAALALSEVALAAGDRVGLLTYGRRTHARLAPARGPQHLRAILEALATVTAERSEADHAGAAATVMSAQKQRALIVWLTDLAETAGVPDVVERAAGLSPKHVVLFAIPQQPELGAIAAAAPATEDEMYRMLAVQEMLDRRATLLRGLTQQGVRVVEVAPRAPAALLIDQYLSVKERNLI